MYTLGLSFYYHDSAAVLLKEGQLLTAVQEERFSRKKNDPSFPEKAIDFCLKSAEIKTSELDAVVFYEKPFLKFERILLSSLVTYPKGWRLFREAMKEWFFHKLWIKELISSKLGIDGGRIYFTEHHLSHAASCYYPAGYTDAAIVTIDGVGEWDTATIGYGKGSEIKILKRIRFPHSLGLLYSAFTAFLGFKVNEGEYKVMGMAAFGKPCYVDKIKKLIKLHADSSFTLNLSYFVHQYSPDKLYSDKFLSLFGKPRKKESLFFTRKSGFPKYFGRKPKNFDKLAKENEYYADIAASLQNVMEEAMLSIVGEAFKITGSKNLCLAGGVALNSVANGKIYQRFKPKKFFIQPAAGDAGGALGAALYYQHAVNSHSFKRRESRFVMDHVFYGKEYSDKEIGKFLRKKAITYRFYRSQKALLKKVSKELTRGKVIGWFQGKFEWGPRALGNRSILADPRNPKMKDIVNSKIKFREPYRPFAPSVLAEYTSEFFDYKPLGLNDPSLFMIIVVPVKKEKQSLIPAVTHVDGSGRLQTVSKKFNLPYWQLINQFYQDTKIPLVLNTSFNLRGEPIVESPKDAYNTFVRSEMDVLVMGRYIIEKLKVKS